MKNSINENGQCAGKGKGKGDGDGNNGAAHELKRKSLLNQRQSTARGGQEEGVGGVKLRCCCVGKPEKRAAENLC